MKVGPDLYFYPWESQQENNCNSVVLGGKVLTLIDPGHRKHLPRLLGLIERDGLRREDIALIIITHAHPDHMEGCSEFYKSDTLIAMHEEEERFILEEGPKYSAAMGIKPSAPKVDFYLTEGELNLDRHVIQVIHTPGHSPGSISLYLANYGLLVCGDVIFMGGVGRVDIPGGDVTALRNSINRLAQMHLEAIIPGHGPILHNRQLVARNFVEIQRMVNQMI